MPGGRPAPDRFSVAEVLAHLSHSEGQCYRLRLDRFMNEERPELEPDDAQFHLDLYRNADPEDSFDHFEEQRESNIEFLSNLPERAGERRAIHREAGEITMAQMKCARFVASWNRTFCRSQGSIDSAFRSCCQPRMSSVSRKPMSRHRFSPSDSSSTALLLRAT